MTSFESVLSAATQLPEDERLRLIGALWDTVPDDAEVPISSEWLAELDKRVDEMERGEGRTYSWPEVRDAALARLRSGTPT